ncbi:hypothetical protein CASFOL_014403 [Castilleja foliolosa]|uniref:Myb-like domain-containing protein n=1 Tax=Castilleja foliolosa TaxID=1961234 RepID=A0ABD3DMS4_9LAMI
MNPNNPPPPNSQNPNPQFPYPYPNSYFLNPQNFNFNTQTPNSQYSSPYLPTSQIPLPYSQNSPYIVPQTSFSNSQFETQQSPISVANSPHSQVPAFNNSNFIDLNDPTEETEDVREVTGQWKWAEDKLLISAWLNVSIDPVVGTDQKGEAFWNRIQQYCEEDNPGVIKRGAVAMRKRWQRLNEGAQKFGACHAPKSFLIF